MLWIMWIMLVLFILVFNYSAGKNNESYDLNMFQKRCFDKYVNSGSLVFVKYIGSDECKVENGDYALVTIDTTDEDKILVGLNNKYIQYDNFEQFKRNWKFNNED